MPRYCLPVYEGEGGRVVSCLAHHEYKLLLVVAQNLRALRSTDAARRRPLRSLLNTSRIVSRIRLCFEALRLGGKEAMKTMTERDVFVGPGQTMRPECPVKKENARVIDAAKVAGTKATQTREYANKLLDPARAAAFLADLYLFYCLTPPRGKEHKAKLAAELTKADRNYFQERDLLRAQNYEWWAGEREDDDGRGRGSVDNSGGRGGGDGDGDGDGGKGGGGFAGHQGQQQQLLQLQQEDQARASTNSAVAETEPNSILHNTAYVAPTADAYSTYPEVSEATHLRGV